MKKIFLWLSLILFPLGLAGDLASLHAELSLADPDPVESCGKAPEGMTAFQQACVNPKPESTISSIGLERTACFGNCPAYTVIIQADGSFRYVGEANVERMGEHYGQVNLGQLKQVLAFIDEINYISLRNTYTTALLDDTSVYTMVEQNGSSKVIENYGRSGPASLWALQELIDQLLENATWE